jgi:hypothetical protein
MMTSKNNPLKNKTIPMKNHFHSLFDQDHRWWTISLAIASAVLVISSMIIGIADNLPGIVLLLAGAVSFFFTLLHPWRKPGNYGILAGVSVGLIALIFLILGILSVLNKTEFISEALVMGFIGLICIPGIFTGVIGSILWSVRGKS